MKYTVRKYQVIYADGSRDRVNLEYPIRTDDYELTRAKLIVKHTGIGKQCKTINMEYDELNNKEV